MTHSPLSETSFMHPAFHRKALAALLATASVEESPCC
ncbi:hypothetical protein J2739_004512 [Variovorax soli]|uniref:Uncharacterized protein n=1 Tax=Variovorax soli TaxID=376815 RepID=A0ABU1NJS7_9BURK|nr:hypothetical protein [Variovorax soli]